MKRRPLKFFMVERRRSQSWIFKWKEDSLGSSLEKEKTHQGLHWSWRSWSASALHYEKWKSFDSSQIYWSVSALHYKNGRTLVLPCKIWKALPLLSQSKCDSSTYKVEGQSLPAAEVTMGPTPLSNIEGLNLHRGDKKAEGPSLLQKQNGQVQCKCSDLPKEEVDSARVRQQFKWHQINSRLIYMALH